MLDREVFSVYLLRLCVLVVSLLQTLIVSLVNKSLELKSRFCSSNCSSSNNLSNNFWYILAFNVLQLLPNMISDSYFHIHPLEPIKLVFWIWVVRTYHLLNVFADIFTFNVDIFSEVSEAVWSTAGNCEVRVLYFAYSWSTLLQSNVIDLKCYT